MIMAIAANTKGKGGKAGKAKAGGGKGVPLHLQNAYAPLMGNPIVAAMAQRLNASAVVCSC